MSEALRSVFAEFGFKVDTDDLKKLEDELRAATKATGILPDATAAAAAKTKKKLAEIAEASKKLSTSAQQAHVDHAAKKLFDASDEGKAHAAWKRLVEAEEEAKKPVVGLMGIVEKLGAQVQQVIGRRIPEAWKRAFEKLGVARGDVKTMGGIVLGVGAAVAAATALAFRFASAFAADAEAIRDFAREARVSTSDLQGLRYAAVQGGVGVERMDASITRFGQSLRSAGTWGNGTTFMLRRLGIQTRDASGHIRPTIDLLDDVAVAMEHVASPRRRMRIADQLGLDRRTLDILHTGAGGIRALRREAEQYGGGITPEAVAASREYTQATAKLTRAQDSLRSVLAVSLLPILSSVVSHVALGAGRLANLTHGTHVLQIAFAAMGVVAAAVAIKMIVAFAPVVAPYIAIAAAVAAVVIALDDLITFVEGGDSAIGRFIDSVAGVGTSVEYVHELREEWEAVQNAIAGAIAKLAEWTGLGEQQAQGHLSGPHFGPPAGRPGARRAPTVTAIPTSAITIAGAGGQSVTVPATRGVVAPGGAGATRTVVHSTTHNHGDIHVHGITDPDRAADRVEQILDQRARDRRDGDRPVADDDDDHPTHGVE